MYELYYIKNSDYTYTYDTELDWHVANQVTLQDPNFVKIMFSNIGKLDPGYYGIAGAKEYRGDFILAFSDIDDLKNNYPELFI